MRYIYKKYFINQKSQTPYTGNKDITSQLKSYNSQIINNLVLTPLQTKRFFANKEITLTTGSCHISSNNSTKLQQKESTNQNNWKWIEIQDICEKIFPNFLNDLLVEKDQNWNGIYLLSALNTIATQPIYLFRMIETKNKNPDNPNLMFNNQLIIKNEKENQFYFHFLFNGVIQRISIDNMIPCLLGTNQSIHISSQTYGFSPLFLKAYSSIYGGYDKIQNGIFGQLIRDITWAPFEYVQIIDPQAIFEYIAQNLSKNYIITLCEQLDNCWADCVLTISQDSDTNKVLVKKGKDGSERWICFDDLQQIYNYCGVNKCNEEYYYSFITQNLNQQLVKEVFVVQFESSQNINHSFITITQQDKRCFSNSYTQPNEYSYDFTRMILVQGSLNAVNRQINIDSWVADHSQIGRDATIECFLNQGTYLLCVEIEKSTPLQTRICFNSYSQEKISFQFAERQDLFQKISPLNSSNFIKTNSLNNQYDQQPNNEQGNSILNTVINNITQSQYTNINANYQKFNSNHEQNIIEKFLISKTNKKLDRSNQIYYYQEDQEISRASCLSANIIYFIYENNSPYGSVLKEKHRIYKRNDSSFNKEWYVEVYPKQKKIVSYTIPKDEDINDVIIDLIFTDFTLSERKIMLNIKQMPSSNKDVKEQRSYNGKHIDSFMTTYQYHGGYSILYENFTNQTCTETLHYKISNLFGDEFNEENKSFSFILYPGQHKLLRLYRQDHSKSINCSLKSTFCIHG